jgi:hypothetical protein
VIAYGERLLPFRRPYPNPSMLLNRMLGSGEVTLLPVEAEAVSYSEPVSRALLP